MLSRLNGPTLALAALLLSLECAAGSTSRTFGVVATLNPAPPSGVCISQSLSESTGALVKVACQTGQFVSIEPRPGAPYAGSNGFAYSYFFSPASAARVVGTSGIGEGGGTITTYRVYLLDGSSELLNLLVKF